MQSHKLSKTDLQEIESAIKDGISSYKLAEKYNVHPETIYYHFENLIKNTKEELKVKRNLRILQLFKENPNILAISKATGYCQSLISKIIKENGLTPTLINQHSLLHKKDENFFKIINTEEKAYFLGLLYADGCVHIKSHPKRSSSIKYVVSIGLKQPDKYILQKFSDLIFNKEKLSTYEYKRNKDFEPEVRLTIYSKKICEDLIKLGCIPRKSLILKFPTEEQVPGRLISHFIRGYFDGDGSISINTKNPNSIKGIVSICSSTEFIESLKLILSKLEIQSNTSYSQRSDWGALQFASKNSINKFFDFLYQDATVFLKRKYDKFVEYRIKNTKSIKK